MSPKAEEQLINAAKKAAALLDRLPLSHADAVVASALRAAVIAAQR